MKATGLIRRIDDLGRVVIPKEIRRSLNIREGDALELYTEGDLVIFKKYSHLNEYDKDVKPIVEVLAKTLSKPVIVTDRDIAVECHGISKANVLMKNISMFTDDVMTNKQTYIRKEGEDKEILTNANIPQKVLLVKPIVCCGEVYGSIILLSENDVLPTKHEIDSVEMMASLISNRISEY